MKLKTNNKFSKWLFKLACKFRYSPLLPKPNVVYITPKNLEECCIHIKVPEYFASNIDYLKNNICCELAKSAVFKQNSKFTSNFNYEDNTTTIHAKLYILNKKGLEDFYGRD